MKFHISKFHNALQRVKYAQQYGIWYFENEVYFRTFLDLKQGELSILEYGDMFAWLQDKCGLEDEERDLISFVRGLRPDIVESMNDCTTIHETYWEAIHVEYMLKWSPLGKVAPHDEKSRSSQLTTAHVEESVVEDLLIQFKMS